MADSISLMFPEEGNQSQKSFSRVVFFDQVVGGGGYRIQPSFFKEVHGTGHVGGAGDQYQLS